ncbi:MAG: hypothetical protein II912_10575, partial [Clostridia bacterium]|nr:hypothetical protein [Clostridia bacterium]
LRQARDRVRPRAVPRLRALRGLPLKGLLNNPSPGMKQDFIPGGFVLDTFEPDSSETRTFHRFMQQVLFFSEIS